MANTRQLLSPQQSYWEQMYPDLIQAIARIRMLKKMRASVETVMECAAKIRSLTAEANANQEKLGLSPFPDSTTLRFLPEEGVSEKIERLKKDLKAAERAMRNASEDNTIALADRYKTRNYTELYQKVEETKAAHQVALAALKAEEKAEREKAEREKAEREKSAITAGVATLSLENSESVSSSVPESSPRSGSPRMR